MPGFDKLDAMLIDFGVDLIKPDASIVKVLWDVNDEELLTGMIVSADYRATGKTSALKSLTDADTVSVDGTSYKVKKVMKIEDGLLSVVYLSEAA